MKNICKKLFALLLCVMLCCSLMPVYADAGKPVWATGEDEASSETGAKAYGGPAVANGSDHGLIAWVYAANTGHFQKIECGFNRTAKLKVVASVSDGTPIAYQWYELNQEDVVDIYSGSFSYTASQAISKANKSTYTTTAMTEKTPSHYYGCVATDIDGATAQVLFEVSASFDTFYNPPVNTGNGVYLPYLFAITIDQGYYYSLGHGSSFPTPVYTLSNATKYEIFRTETGGKWKSLKTIEGGGPTGPEYGGSWNDYIRNYMDKTTKMGVTYYYRYRAYLNEAWTDKTTTKSITFNPFADVSLEEERAQYIAWAYNNDVIKGTLASPDDILSPRLFNPDDPCTRMNFVMILWKMHGKPSVSGSNPFSDVSGSTSVKAVKWAVKKKLVTGTSATTFSPDDNLSRINIIMILYKLAGSPKASATSKYEDISGSKTTKAVNWAVSKGIISPVDETHFAPDANCSRALLVEILCKYNEIYKIL